MPLDLKLLHGSHSPVTKALVDKSFTYYTLQFIESGCVELFYDDERYELNKNWVWPAHPGPHIRFHAWPRGRSWNHRYMAFSGPRVAEWEEGGLVLLRPQEVPSAHVGEFIFNFDQLHRYAKEYGRQSEIRAVNLLESLLLDLASWRSRDADSMTLKPPWFEELKRAVESFDEEPNYENLAKSQGISVNTLRTTFRKLTGTSPHRYRIAYRAALAKHMLGETTEPIKTISAKLNFTDVFYFNKQFKQEVGVPPALYRRSRQG